MPQVRLIGLTQDSFSFLAQTNVVQFVISAMAALNRHFVMPKVAAIAVMRNLIRHCHVVAAGRKSVTEICHGLLSITLVPCAEERNREGL